jgi:hypothetical protein
VADIRRVSIKGLCLVAGVAMVFGGVVATGVSWASIPDSSGVVHGCYKTSGTAHALKVIDNSVTASCPSGFTSLNWDQSPPGIGVGTGTATVNNSAGAQCTLGQIDLFAQQGDAIPDNFKVAAGQVLSISSATALFDLLGTTYGGNGTSTFKLPNVQTLAPDHMTYGMCVSGVFP